MTAFVSVEIFDDEPWRLCGTQTPSGERRKFVRRVISDKERHLARAEPSARGRQTPGQAKPVKAVSRRSRARKARALTGVGWSGSASIRADVSATTHCADFLSAKENPDSCNVRLSQKNCDKLLHCHTTDRGAPCAFYPAIKRSMSRASPVLRRSSTNCDEAKSGRASQEQIPAAVDMPALR